LGAASKSLMIATDTHDYVSKAIFLAENSVSVRQKLCAAKSSLFGPEVLTEVVDEWKEFLRHIIDKMNL
jgi:predicted O-linked N-acetylglucosamine transferase (SPINDLY family)